GGRSPTSSGWASGRPCESSCGRISHPQERLGRPDDPEHAPTSALPRRGRSGTALHSFSPASVGVCMNSEARVLITGCGGMLGDAVYSTFADSYQHVHATDIVLNEPWLSHLDVRELD